MSDQLEELFKDAVRAMKKLYPAWEKFVMSLDMNELDKMSKYDEWRSELAWMADEMA